MLTLFVSCDNLIPWNGMALESSGAPVNDATVTFTLKDASDQSVTGAVNIAMPYVASSDGDYEGVLESTVVLVVNDTYYLEVTAVSGGANGFRRIECVAAYQDEE